MILLAASGLGPTSAAAQSRQPAAKVDANYDIAFAGVDIGNFRFNSNVAGRRYDLTTNANVKVFFGAFKWFSQTRTEGTIGTRAQPASFMFDFSIKKKRKRSALEFERGNVVKLDNKPPLNLGAKHVLLKPEHLRGVVDPMTAIMRMTDAATGEPCRETLEIFDGRLRIRLTLTPKGRRRIAERRPSGQPDFGYVCRVKFTPVAGHKREQNINFIAGNDGIEIVLRPVPSANILVPYQIIVPTLVGSVTITARKVDIVSATNQRIALIH